MGMALFCNTIGIPYRQLQGIAEDCLGEKDTPNFSAIYKRINKLNLEEGNYKTWFSDGKTKTEIIFLAGDSTGLKPTSRGDWMGAKWNIRRGFIKMHIMVDAKTKKIYAVSIIDEKSGDAPEFKKLLSGALQNTKDSPNVEQSEELLVGCDGAYDSNDNFDECEKNDVTPVIPVRNNFSVKTKGSDVRKQQDLVIVLDEKFRNKGYGKIILKLGLNAAEQNRFTAIIKKDNIPSIRLYTKLGYVKTGETDNMILFEYKCNVK